jgi:hypothetical protein
LLIAAILLGGCGGGGSSSASGTGTSNETLKPVLTKTFRRRKLDEVEVEVPPLTPGEVRQLDCQLISSVMKYAGSYSGTYDGNDTGTFNVSITNEGIATGSGTSNVLGTFSVAGSVAAGGGLSMSTSGTAAGATYSGTIDVATGKVSGTWSGSGTSGNFSGQKQP